MTTQLLKHHKKIETKTERVMSPVGGEEYTLLVAVGCGGVFYHGLSRMVVWCQRRDDVRIILIDPDKVEAKNQTRQWGGTTIGVHKATVAETVLGAIGINLKWVRSTAVPLKGKEGLEAAILRETLMTLEDKNLQRIMVISLPDNHKCRMDVHEGCKELAKLTGKEVFEITGGNTPTDGYAYGCVWTPRPLKFKGETYEICKGDWAQRHYDIVDEAKAEEKGKAQPMGCGAMKPASGEMEQTATGNMLTAMCVWDLAEMMIAENKVGEVLWTTKTVQGRKSIVVRANLQERGK